MLIKTTFTENEYVKAVLHMRRWLFILYISGYLLLVYLSLLFLQKWYVALAIAGLIYDLYSKTKAAAERNFELNRLREPIEYQFGSDYLVIKRGSDSMQLAYAGINRVTQNKSWIIIWEYSPVANAQSLNKRLPNFITKRDLQQGDFAKVKEILNRHNVRNTL